MPSANSGRLARTLGERIEEHSLKKSQKTRRIESLLQRVEDEANFTRDGNLYLRVKNSIITIVQRASIVTVMCLLLFALGPIILTSIDIITVLLAAFFLTLLFWYLFYTPRRVTIDFQSRELTLELNGFLALFIFRRLQVFRGYHERKWCFNDLTGAWISYDKGNRLGITNRCLNVGLQHNRSILLVWSSSVSLFELVRVLNLAIIGIEQYEPLA